MDWPSERVAQGGFLQNPKVNYSRETQDLLKVLMEESRLTMMQRKKINYHLRNGDPLPLLHENKRPGGVGAPPPVPNSYRARSCRRRTLDSILESDAFNVERFVPKNAYKETSDMAKLKLQEQMSGYRLEKDLEKVKGKYKHRRVGGEDEDFDPVEELLREINERVEWLDEMEKLGEAKKHRNVIQGQIEDRLCELKRLKSQYK